MGKKDPRVDAYIAKSAHPGEVSYFESEDEALQLVR